MTNEAFIAELLGLLLERETFLITSHARPDGDAIGSSLGMMHLLEGMGKKVTVVFTDRFRPSTVFFRVCRTDCLRYSTDAVRCGDSSGMWIA